MKKTQVQVKGRSRKNLAFFWGMLMFFCVAGAVQAADSRFQEVEGSNGSIVRDSTTGLEWQRCPHGQSWTGSGCSGGAWEGNWNDAEQVTASGGFRLPTIDELKTLAPYDQNVFPGAHRFWSSSPYVAYNCSNCYVWALIFNDGYVGGFFKYGNCRARLVRGGQ